jgi:hypothetical protein
MLVGHQLQDINMSGFLNGISTTDIMILAVGTITAWNAHQAGKIKRTGEATHLLSNSAMGEQKKLNVDFARRYAVQAHRFADMTNLDSDIAAAVAADVVVKEQESIYNQHLVQQAKVDAKAES